MAHHIWLQLQNSKYTHINSMKFTPKEEVEMKKFRPEANKLIKKYKYLIYFVFEWGTVMNERA